MIYFLSDYSQGAHSDVMEALMRTNSEHSDGYCTDEHCENAARMIKNMCSERRFKFSRIDRKKEGHKRDIKYILAVGV